jgi:glycosyltransferase involved in cell wall biosynthesis
MASEARNEPLAVAFVSSHARAGGAERYLEQVLELLGPDWVRVVVALEDGPLVERLRATYHPHVIPTGAGWTSILGSARRLRTLLRNHEPQLVHANGVKAAIVSVLAAAGTKIPVVWVRHDFSYDGHVARLVAGRCRVTVGVSEAVARGLPHARVVYPALVADDGSASAAHTREAHAVVLVGYFHPVKGQAELVEAAPSVLARVPDARFLFVGGEDPDAGGYLDTVRARARDLGVEHAVSFLGHRADAGALIGSSDVAVVTTLGKGEGFGLAALEALAAGTPVAGYASGALPEIVGDCGRLVPASDRTALANAIVELLGDDALRTSLASCGRERARERFSVERWRSGLVDAYREAA